ncbi:GIN domain-containing protein [Poritiphilus flavus]|uniref:Putative auto-transporter adhesin head GIN domain-containing protein n=1 Tax=Poritiphilus flavus TaxID=2697053 RepID=A0A6L9EA20_9FLAO|nr:DUF2807 domain-containing protein [Poritiphilus flavus]NAS11615.1 hypothetical protein [Poritiphilus flavus]
MKSTITLTANWQDIKGRSMFTLCILMLCGSGLYSQDQGTANAMDLGKVVPQFNQIYVSGVAKVFFKQGSGPEITEKLEGNTVPELIKEVKNGVLRVYTKGPARGETVEVYVSNPELKKVEVWDRGEFYNTDTLKAEVLEVEVNELGAAFMVVDTQEVLITMNGGDLDIGGITRKQQVTKTPESDRGTLKDAKLIIVEK